MRIVLLLVCLFSAALCRQGQADSLERTNLEWSVSIADTSDSTPALAPDGTIYFGTFLGKLRALNPDGSSKWTFSAGLEIQSSPAVGADGTVYFGSRDRKLYAVTPQGKKKWTYKTGAWVDSSPAIAPDGTVYCGSRDHTFFALNPADGSRKWQFETGGQIESSPAIGADGTIYFGSHDRSFYALSPDGKQRWASKTLGAIVSSPAIDRDGTVYMTSLDGWFYALNPDGSLKWKIKTGSPARCSPVIGEDGTLYVAGLHVETDRKTGELILRDSLWAVTPDGTKKWEHPYIEPIDASPLALSDNSVCFVSRYGNLINLTKPPYPKWNYYLYGHGFASPVANANGTIYITRQRVGVGWFFEALKNDVPPAKSPWPKFRGNSANTGLAVTRSGS